MNKFIFNATKSSMKPQTTRYGNPKTDRYGNPLASIQVKFDHPKMKIEAIRRMHMLAILFATDADLFPKELQSGTDPKPQLTSNLYSGLYVKSRIPFS